MLIDVRIVCAHEALETAQKLKRLLSAEGHQVELSYGKGSLALLETSRVRREAVLVIWSDRAQAALYPLQWARATEPARLVELAFCADWPPLDGRADVIDFMAWKGQRGGAGWRALQDRLRGIAKAAEPPKPQPRAAALALIGASLVAAAGAVWARFDAERAPLEPPTETTSVASLDAPSIGGDAQGGDAQGGPLVVSEPESYAPTIRFRPRFAHTALADIRPMAPAHFTAPMDFSEPNLFERIFDRDRPTPPPSVR